MKLGNAAWGLRDTPLEDKLSITRDMGLNYLELSIGGYDKDYLQLDADEEKLDYVRELFGKYNVELECGSASCNFTDGNRENCEAAVKNVKAVIDIAEKLGVKFLRIFAGFNPVADVTGETWSMMIESLNAVLEHASGTDVMPAIETHGGVGPKADGIMHFHSTTTTEDTLDRMIAEFEYPFSFLFDPANLGAVGLNEEQILNMYRKYKAHISCFHIKDFAQTPGGALTPSACGEGQLDWSMLWPEFSKFEGPGLNEYELVEDIEDGLRRTVSHLEQL